MAESYTSMLFIRTYLDMFISNRDFKNLFFIGGGRGGGVGSEKKEIFLIPAINQPFYLKYNTRSITADA